MLTISCNSAEFGGFSVHIIFFNSAERSEFEPRDGDGNCGVALKIGNIEMLLSLSSRGLFLPV